MTTDFDLWALTSRCERTLTLSKPRIPAYQFRGQADKIKSLPSDFGVASKKESVYYTGINCLGIATLHKSNAIPIFTTQEAEDVARMRR